MTENNIKKIINRKLKDLNGNLFDLNQETEEITNEILSSIEKPMDQNLEGEINRMWPILGHYSSTELGFTLIARHFADWQSRKEAGDYIDGCIGLIIGSEPTSLELYLSTTQLYEVLKKYKNGDKVTVKIFKK